MMELFPPDPAENLLPCDGVVIYHGRMFDAADARRHFDILLETVPWRHDEVVMFGKRIVTAREVAWFGDRDYRYSGSTKKAQAWTAELLELKSAAERLSGESFNSCLLNLYHHGGEGMGWHSDDEPEIAPHSAIASLSFGAERRFCLKHKCLPHKVDVLLEHGSLLVMKGETQAHWLHSIPKSTKVTAPRINLTFRKLTP